uniref:Uncharacterized protein n=1 Tax=Meloidogyne hapla TaxID=6305 RepID=A0A1I8BX62_MELHA
MKLVEGTKNNSRKEEVFLKKVGYALDNFDNCGLNKNDLKHMDNIEKFQNILAGYIAQNIHTSTPQEGKILNYLKNNYQNKCKLIFKKCLIEKFMENIRKNPQYASDLGIGIPRVLDIELG